MKSILFKIWKFPQLSETFIVNQVVVAIKLGYDVRILCEEVCDIPGNTNLELFRKFELEEKLIKEDYKMPRTKRGRIIRTVGLILKRPGLILHLYRFYRINHRKGFFSIFQFFFYESLKGYDIIHIQFGTNKYPIDILKKTGFFEGQLITSFHGHDLHFPINKIVHREGYYNDLFEVANWLICNTPFLENKLNAINAPLNKIKTIPIPVDTAYFTPMPNKTRNGKLKLITVGRLDELKGQEFGIKAISHLVKKGAEVEYIIAGTGDWESNLKSLVKEYELEGKIIFTGKVSPQRVRSLLQDSDIFLMTSVTNEAGMQESQGLVTAEAQACGLPVVAFNTGGVKHTLVDRETGFLCEEKDLETFVEKIELLINEPVLREEMGLSARKFIEKEYSEASVMKKWQEIYG